MTTGSSGTGRDVTGAARGIGSQRTPVPLQRWHFTTLSPFFTRPLPSQFLHFCFFLMFGPFSFGMKYPMLLGAEKQTCCAIVRPLVYCKPAGGLSFAVLRLLTVASKLLVRQIPVLPK